MVGTYYLPKLGWSPFLSFPCEERLVWAVDDLIVDLQLL
jgi:hypothetical protein